MATHTDGGAAFPGAFNRAEDKGMSLRDWFAGQAMMGFIATGKIYRGNCDIAANDAYLVADAMLAAREK